MKREEIKAIFPDATDEQLDKTMSLHGADVEKQKAKSTALEAEIKEKKEAFDKLNSEFEALKSTNAGAEDWKAKFEALQAENIARERKAEAERLEKEKSENISKRFENVVGEREFNHPAIRQDVLRRFGEAVSHPDNVGKSDADIFHELTKDDAAAFKGVTSIRISGGSGKTGTKQYSSMEEIMQIKDRQERRAAIAQNLINKGEE